MTLKSLSLSELLDRLSESEGASRRYWEVASDMALPDYYRAGYAEMAEGKEHLADDIRREIQSRSR